MNTTVDQAAAGRGPGPDHLQALACSACSPAGGRPGAAGIAAIAVWPTHGYLHIRWLTARSHRGSHAATRSRQISRPAWPSSGGASTPPSSGCRRALQLVVLSVAFGLVSGVFSLITGLDGHSLGVLAIGLGVLADVIGSAILIWRFRAEHVRSSESEAHETRAAIVVAAALAVASVVLAAESMIALATGTRPGTSDITLIAAGISVVILTPLAYAKRRTGLQMGSQALQGDGALSGIGAATSLLALAALVVNDTFGWWWADRVAALVVAGVAAIAARHTAPRSRAR